MSQSQDHLTQQQQLQSLVNGRNAFCSLEKAETNHRRSYILQDHKVSLVLVGDSEVRATH